MYQVLATIYVRFFYYGITLTSESFMFSVECIVQIGKCVYSIYHLYILLLLKLSKDDFNISLNFKVFSIKMAIILSTMVVLRHAELHIH